MSSHPPFNKLKHLTTADWPLGFHREIGNLKQETERKIIAARQALGAARATYAHQMVLVLTPAEKSARAGARAAWGALQAHWLDLDAVNIELRKAGAAPRRHASLEQLQALFGKLIEGALGD